MAPSAPASSVPQANYNEVERLDDADGARAIITKRTRGSVLYTVMFGKHYRDAEDRPAQTSFFTRKTLASLRRIIDVADKRLAELEAEDLAERQAEPSQSANRR